MHIVNTVFEKLSTFCADRYVCIRPTKTVIVFLIAAAAAAAAAACSSGGEDEKWLRTARA